MDAVTGEDRLRGKGRRAHLAAGQMHRFRKMEGCFHVLASVNSAAVNTGVHVSFQVMVFCRYKPRSGIAGSYGNSIFSFLRNLHTVLHSGCYQFTFPPTVQEGSFFSTPSPALLFIDFLMMAILTGVRRDFIVVLICISLIISDVEHLFIGFFYPILCNDLYGNRI